MATQTITISNGDDDGYYDTWDGGCYYNAEVIIGGVNGDAVRTTLVFRGLLPRGGTHTITSARLHLHSAIARSPTQTVTIKADLDTTPASCRVVCNPLARTLSSSSVDWELPTVGVGEWFYSNDFAAVLQEFIDGGGGDGGDVAICILGNSGGGDQNHVWCSGYEDEPEYAAQLVVTYEDRVGGSMI